MSGRNFRVDIKNLSAAEIARHANTLADSSGKKHGKLQQPVRTRNPSIQGNWTPFHADVSLPESVGKVVVRRPESK